MIALLVYRIFHQSGLEPLSLHCCNVFSSIKLLTKYSTLVRKNGLEPLTWHHSIHNKYCGVAISCYHYNTFSNAGFLRFRRFPRIVLTKLTSNSPALSRFIVIRELSVGFILLPCYCPGRVIFRFMPLITEWAGL